MTNGDADGWHTPRKFLTDFDGEEDAAVMSRAGKKLREEYLLARLCLLIGADRFRTLPTEDFDGQYAVGNRHTLVEVTEILDEGRRRNLEYEPGAPQSISIPINKENIAQRIHEAVLKKTVKKAKLKTAVAYPIELLIYLNLNVFGNVEKDVCGGLAALPPHCFDRVHVLIGTHTLMSRKEAGEISVARLATSLSDF